MDSLTHIVAGAAIGEALLGKKIGKKAMLWGAIAGSAPDIDAVTNFFVSDIEENSGAEKAGIKQGDIIKKIDHITISKFSDLSGYLSTKRPNDVVNLNIIRNGSEKTIPVTLSKIEIATIDFLDMQLRNIPSDIKKSNKEINKADEEKQAQEKTIVTPSKAKEND